MLAIFLIGRKKHLFDPVIELKANFRNVSGLQVIMIIQKSEQPFIKTDCKAIIGSEGIIGSHILVITQGSAGARFTG